MHVNVTQFRRQLPAFLQKARTGTPVSITSHGKVIARLVPEEDAAAAAKARLVAMRDKAVIVDVESPLDVKWNAQSGRL